VTDVTNRLKSAEVAERLNAVHVLSLLGSRGKAAAPALRRATNDGDRLVRERAVMALGSITQGSEEQVPFLLDVLRRPDLGMVQSAAAALGAVGPAAASAVPALTSVLENRRLHRTTHQIVAAALERIGTPAA